MCLLLILGSAPVMSEALKLVTLQYPPYSYEQGNSVNGLSVAVVKEVFKRLDQPITIEVLPWGRAIYRIQKGLADGIFTIFKTQEREDFAIFSEEVVVSQIISLFVSKQSDIYYLGDLGNLLPHTFGSVRAVYYGKVFEDLVASGGIKNLELVNTGENNLRKLLGNRFDILVSNKYGALHILSEMNALDQVRELQPALQTLPSYMAFPRDRGLEHIRDQFDAQLRAMKADGTYASITEKFLQ